MNHPKIQKILIKIQKLEALRARRLRPILNQSNRIASSKVKLLDKVDALDAKLAATDRAREKVDQEINIQKAKIVGELTKTARDLGESPTQYLLNL